MVTVAVPLGCLLYCAAVALALDLFAETAAMLAAYPALPRANIQALCSAAGARLCSRHTPTHATPT